MDKYIKSKDLILLLMKYVNRIKDFYKFSTENEQEINNSLRHIEIIRIQISNEIKLIEMEELESQFIYSILSDSYYFEKHNTESKEWKINFIRLTWSRLLDDLDCPLDSINVEILKNTYVDSNTRENGRNIYQKYKSK